MKVDVQKITTATSLLLLKHFATTHPLPPLEMIYGSGAPSAPQISIVPPPSLATSYHPLPPKTLTLVWYPPTLLGSPLTFIP